MEDSNWLTMPERSENGQVFAYISGDKIKMSCDGVKSHSSFFRGILKNMSMKEDKAFDWEGRTIPAKRKHVFTFTVYFDATGEEKTLNLEMDAADGSAAPILNVLAGICRVPADFRDGHPILQISAYLNDNGKPRVSVKTPDWNTPGTWKHPEKAYPYANEPGGGIEAKAVQNAAGVWDFSALGLFWHRVFLTIGGNYGTKGITFDSPFVKK